MQFLAHGKAHKTPNTSPTLPRAKNAAAQPTHPGWRNSHHRQQNISTAAQLSTEWHQILLTNCRTIWQKFYICNYIAIKLTIKRKYKTIIAALMLAVYAFVATPVSYWHHHNSANTSSSTKQQQQTIEKISVISADANCKICSHHYSVFNDDAVKLLISSAKQLSPFNGFFFIKDIPNPGYSQSNKGPPSIL